MTTIARASTWSSSPFPHDPYAVRRREALYRWFAAMCRERGHTRVLDAGSGDGFGAAILAAAGLHVVAIDVDVMTLAIAARTYRFGRLEFRRSDARRVGALDASFDAVLSPCLIEHLSDPDVALDEARRLVRDGGTVVVATPNRLRESPGRTLPIDAEHVWEFTAGELNALVTRRFPSVLLYGLGHGRQLRVLEGVTGESPSRTVKRLAPADRSWWLQAALRRVRAVDFDIGPADLRDAVDLIAVCRR